MQQEASIHKLTDQLFRREAGKMVAVLSKIFGTENLELAEDVVQETFLKAVQVWPLKGLPENPPAWLMQVAKNKAIDVIRKNRFSTQIDFNEPGRQLLQSEFTLTTYFDNLWRDDIMDDDMLHMMFACCHPGIAIEMQVTLMLKTIGGFSTAEIASAFLCSDETISKRLYRTREFFREHKIKPAFPNPAQLKERVDAVLKTIYLIFNEGYNASHHDTLIRNELMEQAMYLGKILCKHLQTQLPQVLATMALMCLHAARTKSRMDASGDIILLENQDRGLWNRELIEEGIAYLNRAAFGDVLTTYHLEAAIAYEHCTSPSLEQTNWARILAFYDLLLTINPNPVVALNRLAVIFKLKGAAQVIDELKISLYINDWQNNPIYYSLLGDVYANMDNCIAKENYEKSIALTTSAAEKNLLKKKLMKLE